VAAPNACERMLDFSFSPFASHAEFRVGGQPCRATHRAARSRPWRSTHPMLPSSTDMVMASLLRRAMFRPIRLWCPGPVNGHGSNRRKRGRSNLKHNG